MLFHLLLKHDVSTYFSQAPHCEIHSFDKKIPYNLKSQWFSEEQLRKSKVETHEMYISAKDDLTINPPHRSVPSIMAELGHTHIDILKVRFIDAIMQFIICAYFCHSNSYFQLICHCITTLAGGY